MTTKTQPPKNKRAVFILLVWNNQEPDQPPHWRGYLETTSGERHYFRALDELNRLLRDLAGWHDPPGGDE